MPVALRKLNDLVGKEILVVVLDGKAYKGRLTEIDDKALVISSALEFSPADKKWKIPVISVPPESSVEGDIIRTDKMETLKMREIIISFNGILRIYPLATKAVTFEKPAVPVTPYKPPAAPPKADGGYVIRSVSTSDEKDKKKW